MVPDDGGHRPTGRNRAAGGPGPRMIHRVRRAACTPPHGPGDDRSAPPEGRKRALTAMIGGDRAMPRPSPPVPPPVQPPAQPLSSPSAPGGIRTHHLEDLCVVAPAPELREQLKEQFHRLREQAPGLLAEHLGLKPPEHVGFNDGLIFPGTYYPVGTTAAVARRAALDRSPLRGGVLRRCLRRTDLHRRGGRGPLRDAAGPRRLRRFGEWRPVRHPPTRGPWRTMP